MKEKLIALLNDIDEDIVSFEGDDLFEAGVIDSFTVLEIVTAMEKAFGVEIDADDVVRKNLCSVDNMLKMLEKVIEEKGTC